ncbi:MAG: hypothetical protein GY847_41395 [Proteobacteria bacterium]|nr:hypothetical protein [Pseudomonadota bacterium]
MKICTVSVVCLVVSFFMGCSANKSCSTQSNAKDALNKLSTPDLVNPTSWSGLAWPPDGDHTNRLALSRLIQLPTENGNACELYAKLTAVQGVPLPYPDLGVNMDTSLKGSDEEKEKLKALAKDAEVIKRLELFKQGAAKADCHTFGAVFPWPKEVSNPIAWKILDFRPIMQHTAVAQQLARDLADQGKLDEATEWLETLVIVGWHFQQDTLLISNLIGIKIGSHAARHLGELHKQNKAQEKSALGDKWLAYSGTTAWKRHEMWTGLLKKLLVKERSTSDEDLELLAAIAGEPRMMRGARFEAMLATSILHLRKEGTPPPSERQRELIEQWQKQNDPDLASAAKNLAAFLELDGDKRKKIGLEIQKTD